MQKLLEFIISEIAGKETKVDITETVEGDRITYKIVAPKELMGLIIGKGGKTIKAIRNILKVKATLDKKGVFVILEEKI